MTVKPVAVRRWRVSVGVLAVSVGLLSACSDQRVADLRVGDCFNDTDETLQGETFGAVPVVPCDEPHDNEVYLVAEYSGSSYSGIDNFAFDRCYGAFSSFVGTSYERSVLEFLWLSPSKSGWENGRRSVICFVYRDGYTIRGSVRGSGD